MQLPSLWRVSRSLLVGEFGTELESVIVGDIAHKTHLDWYLSLVSLSNEDMDVRASSSICERNCLRGKSHAHLGFRTPVAVVLPRTIMSNNMAEGRREDALVKQRNQAREEYERQKQQLINETEKARPSAHRFVGQNDSMEDSLKNSTVGLVKLEDFQQKRKELEEAKAREAARTDELK
jgi:hypothetical protein